MKFKLPPHCSALSHGGVTYAAAEDGTIEAPEADAAILAAHGILPWEGGPANSPERAPDLDGLEGLTRPRLAAAYRAFGGEGPLPRSNSKLRAALHDLMSGPSPNGD